MLAAVIIAAALLHAAIEVWAARRALRNLPAAGAERMAAGIRRTARRQLMRAGLALAVCALPMPSAGWAADQGYGWIAGLIAAALFLTLREIPFSAAGLNPAPPALAQGLGVPLLVRSDGAAARQWNARAEGVGPFRRIVLTEALLAGLPADEAAAVIAHEGGHLACRHREWYLLWRLGWVALALGTAWIVNGGILAPVDLLRLLSAAPILALPVRPLENRLIRRWEEQADRHAVARVGAETYVRALERLFRANGQGPAPDPLWAALHHPHPPPEERLRRLSPSWS